MGYTYRDKKVVVSLDFRAPLQQSTVFNQCSPTQWHDVVTFALGLDFELKFVSDHPHLANLEFDSDVLDRSM
jgi:hypothetical protein